MKWSSSSGANDLPLVVQIFRADKSHHAVHQKRIEYARHSIRPRFQSELIDAVMRFSRKRASLPRLEIHHIVALPLHVALLMMFQHSFAALAQHRERNSETSIRRLRATNRLKEQIHLCSALHRGKLCCDVRETTCLRGNFVRVNQSRQAVQNREHRIDGI